MDEVVFSDGYGQDRAHVKRFFANEEERSDMPLYQKAGVAAIATAGLLALGHRSGSIRKVTKFLDVQGKAVVQATRETLQQEGSLTKNMNGKRIKKMGKNFVDNKNKILDKQKEAQKDILTSRKFQMEEKLNERSKFVGNEKIDQKGSYEGVIPFHVEEGLRFKQVMKDLREEQSEWAKSDPKIFEKIELAMGRGGTGSMNAKILSDKSEVKMLLKNKGIEDEKYLDALENVRNRYKNKSFTADNTLEVLKGNNQNKKMKTKGKDILEEIMRKTNILSAEELQTVTRANGKIKDAYIGHKQATVGDILKLHNEGKYNVSEELMAKIEEVKKVNKRFDSAVWDENLYFDKKKQELFDYKVLSDIKDKSLEAFSDTLPGALLKTKEGLRIKQAREQVSFRVLNQSTVQPVINGHLKRNADEALEEDVLYVNGIAVRLFDNNKEFNPLNNKNRTGEYKRFYLSSSRYGTMAKIQRSAAGLMTEDKKITILGESKDRNWFEKIFDLRAHDQESDVTNYLSMVTKFANPEWERNKVNKLMNKGVDELSEFYDMKNYLDKYTGGFNQRTLSNLSEFLPDGKMYGADTSIKGFIKDNDISFSREDDVVKLFEHIGEMRGNRNSKEFQQLYKKYQNSPNELLASTTPIGENSLIYGGEVKSITGHDKVKQAVSLELLDMMVHVRNTNDDGPNLIKKKILDKVDTLNKEGSLKNKDVKDFGDLMTNYMFRESGKSVIPGSEETMSNINNLLTGDGEISKVFQQNLKKIVKKNNPIHEPLTTIKPVNKIEDEFMVYNATFNSTTLDGRIKEFFTNFPDLMKQASPMTGRKNMEDFTALSMIGYYMPYRLQGALGQSGLGFSDSSMKNTFDIWKNLFTKRFIPASVGVTAAQYIDYEMDEGSDGGGFSERYQNLKANRRLEDAKGRSAEDIEKAKRKAELTPGSELFNLYPSFELPFTGDFGPGRTLAKTAAGILSGGMLAPSDDDMRNYEEVQEDILNGTEQVRKGRWWAFGSKTAYTGDRVSEFAPNAYRKAHSDYEYTDTMYGDGENWENSWMPNARNPLGALGFLVGTANPYWFEEKHYEDRPYMLTGELFNANTPLLGDVGNATIGKLVKPVKQMHEEYWDMGAEQATELASEYGSRPDGPVVLNVSPGGRTEYEIGITAEDYGGEYSSEEQVEIEPQQETENLDGYSEEISYEDYRNYLKDGGLKVDDRQYSSDHKYAIHSTSENPEEDGAGSVVTDLKTMKRIFIPGRLAKDYNGDYEKAFSSAEERSDLEKQNEEIERQNKYNEVYQTKTRNLSEPEYAYRTEMDKQKLREIIDPRSKEWRLQELSANWMEPQGVYNWIIGDELMGNDPYKGKTIVQRADAASSQSNAFWEQELGSMGGQISEIGRRFIRRDSGQVDNYNPIKNTMPDWMPGGDYFINFQTGDPYEKIQHGEYRLPGEAYKSLNMLHPDETGEYGSFDKFKILADVAPWSDEFRFWRDYVTKNLEDPELRKEMQIIKKQVTKRNEKRDFHEYVFKDADIVEQQVTVKRFLDDYTFITDEFGDTPIRLAGIDSRANSEGAIHHYVSEGDKVKIGIDADPNNRISKDTYGTMRAVVFKNMKNINNELIERGMVKELESDDSAVGVHARYSPKEIRQGKRWETMAHYDSALNTKFLKVRSAVEDYERDQIYGKSWATWQNFGIDDYLKPGYDEMKGELGAKGFVEAGLSGFFIGMFIGRVPLMGGKKKVLTSSILGGVIGLGSNAIAQKHFHSTGERYLPERRLEENDINEYFDFMKYLKNMNLYEDARMDLAHQGFDLDELLNDMNSQTNANKEQRKALEDEKKNLYITQPKGWEERKKEINKELEMIEEEDTSIILPQEVAQALQYKENAETTLYAIDPFGDRLKVTQALPYKDREYFDKFVDASPDEQEQLLTILPENQKRIYKALWGMGAEEPKPIEYFAEKYDIPDPDWEGWNPEYNLEDEKVQIVKKKGLDLSDFNFWEDDVAASQFVPPVNEQNEYKNRGRRSNQEIEQNIREMLTGQGYTGVNVNVMASNSNNSNVRVDYMHDREPEIENEMKYNMDKYI